MIKSEKNGKENLIEYLQSMFNTDDELTPVELMRGITDYVDINDELDPLEIFKVISYAFRNATGDVNTVSMLVSTIDFCAKYIGYLLLENPDFPLKISLKVDAVTVTGKKIKLELVHG